MNAHVGFEDRQAECYLIAATMAFYCKIISN